MEGRIAAGYLLTVADLRAVANSDRDGKAMAQAGNQIVMQPTSEPCYDFTADGLSCLKKTVIIAPIRIDEYDNNKFKVTYGCSRGIYCKDPQCRYVRHFKTEKEEPVAGVESFSSSLDR